MPLAVFAAGLILWAAVPAAGPAVAPAAPGIATPRVLWTGGAPPQMTAFDYSEFPRDTMGVGTQRLLRSRLLRPGVESGDVVQAAHASPPGFARTYWTAQTCCASPQEVAQRVANELRSATYRPPIQVIRDWYY